MSDPASAEGRFVVAQELGFHLRPAGRFARLAGGFTARVEVAIRDGAWVDGQSLLELASLGASHGAVLSIRAEGPDARAAVEALGRLVEDPAEPPAR